MATARYVFWQDGDRWLGYFEDCPDYLTQGITKSSFRSASRQFLPAGGGSRQSEAGVQPARGFSPASEDSTLRSRVCGAEAPRGLKSALQSRRIAAWYAAKPRCETFENLQEHLKDLYRDLTGGEIPGIRQVAELAVP
jgi:hypothetical protein